MDNRTAERLIYMQQLTIRMEGMKAENKQREMQGKALAYGEDEFQALLTEFHQFAP